jgi:hypothetical protein
MRTELLLLLLLCTVTYSISPLRSFTLALSDIYCVLFLTLTNATENKQQVIFFTAIDAVHLSN